MIKNRRLPRALADCGQGSFLNERACQCRDYGKNLLKIDRFAPSSKTCSNCGLKRQPLPLSVRQWEYACGATIMRQS